MPFYLTNITPQIVMAKSFSLSLVALSILIAVFSAFSAFGISERQISADRQSIKIIWNLFGAITFGLGIWGMHFIGMIALTLPVPVAYDISTTIVSMVPACLVGSAVLWLIRQEHLSNRRLMAGGLLLGAGIGLMHFIGMMAMRLNAVMVHHRLLFYISIVVAVILATMALKINSKVSRVERYRFISKAQVLSAIVMGLATSGMHYTAIAAANFIPKSGSYIYHGMDKTSLTIVVSITVFILLGFATIVPLLLRYIELANKLTHLVDSEKEAALRIRAIVDSSLDAMVQINYQGEVIGWNQQAEEIFAWPQKEIMGRQLHKTIIPKRYRKRHKQGIENFLQTGRTKFFHQIIEIEALHYHGHEFPIELIVAPIKVKNGYEFNAFIRDISQRKAYELQQMQLLKEVNFQKYALDQHAIVSITDVNGDITYSNEKFSQISGYSQEELIGQNHRILSSGEHSHQFFTELWDTISSGNTWHGELKNRAKDGHFYWVNATIVPLLDEHNKPQRYVAIRTDISQQKQVELALFKSEERFSLSQHFANIGSWEWDLTSTEVYWSDQVWTLFGLQESGVKASLESFKKIVHPDDFDDVLHALNISVKTGANFEIEHRIIKPDGSVRWLLEQGNVVRSEDNRPLRVLGVAQDITQRKNTENKLKKASQAKSEFLSAMSHELRTPLNAIIGFSQLLMTNTESPLTPAQTEEMGYIISSGRHLAALVDEVLDLTAIEAGKINLFPTSVNVAEMVKESILLVQTTAVNENIRVEVLTDSDVSVYADRTKLKQILLNLLTNAIKYNRPDGSVSVDWFVYNDNKVCIKVIDTGVGIPEEKHKEVFGAFNRLGKENTKVLGSGIGLVVTKSLVELMGGEISFSSKKNEGSTFWFDLPLSE